MRKCEIVLETAGATMPAGYITLDGTTIGLQPTPGFMDLLAGLIVRPNVALGGTPVYPDKDPVKWFEALPYQYHGGSLWAHILE